jgi:hypothetical protein
MVECVFKIEDWRGRIVRLTQHTFNSHKNRHPEFVPYIEAAKETIQDPDFVAETDSGATALFRFGLGEKPFKNLYLVVIIHYEGEIGKEATHYFTSRLGDLSIVEVRHQWVSGLRYS